MENIKDLYFYKKQCLFCVIFVLMFNTGSYAQSKNLTEIVNFAENIVAKNYSSAVNLLQKHVYTNEYSEIELVMLHVYNYLKQNKEEYFDRVVNLVKNLSDGVLKLNVIKQCFGIFVARLPKPVKNLIDLAELVEMEVNKKCPSKGCSLYEDYESYTLIELTKNYIIDFGSRNLKTNDDYYKVDNLWFKDVYIRRQNLVKQIVQNHIDKHYSKTASYEYLCKIFNEEFKEPEAQLVAYQILLDRIYDRNDNEKEEMFIYARHLRQLLEKIHKTLPAHLKDEFIILINTLPDCPRNVVFTKESLCIENSEYVLNAYKDSNRFYVTEGQCSNQILDNTSWKFDDKQKTLAPHNNKFTQSNVEFEIANDNSCYIKINGKYLVKKKDDIYMDYLKEKTPAAMWHVTTVGG